jgi:hypothetical protein
MNKRINECVILCSNNIKKEKKSEVQTGKWSLLLFYCAVTHAQILNVASSYMTVSKLRLVLKRSRIRISGKRSDNTNAIFRIFPNFLTNAETTFE